LLPDFHPSTRTQPIWRQAPCRRRFAPDLSRRSFSSILVHGSWLPPDFHGDFAVVLKNGTRLTLSRRHRVTFEKALGRSL
jgi:hypothetical protein